MSDTNFVTDKQRKILIVICDGNGKDEQGNFVPVDLDELLDRIAYRTTKSSMQFSIRALLRRGLITKELCTRRGARRVCFIPSKRCRQIMGYYNDPSYIEELDLSHIDI